MTGRKSTTTLSRTSSIFTLKGYSPGRALVTTTGGLLVKALSAVGAGLYIMRATFR